MIPAVVFVTATLALVLTLCWIGWRYRSIDGEEPEEAVVEDWTSAELAHIREQLIEEVRAEQLPVPAAPGTDAWWQAEFHRLRDVQGARVERRWDQLDERVGRSWARLIAAQAAVVAVEQGMRDRAEAATAEYHRLKQIVTDTGEYRIVAARELVPA